jgi:hypothetical protein
LLLLTALAAEEGEKATAAVAVAVQGAHVEEVGGVIWSSFSSLSCSKLGVVEPGSEVWDRTLGVRLEVPDLDTQLGAGLGAKEKASLLEPSDDSDPRPCAKLGQ